MVNDPFSIYSFIKLYGNFLVYVFFRTIKILGLSSLLSFANMIKLLTLRPLLKKNPLKNDQLRKWHSTKKRICQCHVLNIFSTVLLSLELILNVLDTIVRIRLFSSMKKISMAFGKKSGIVKSASIFPRLYFAHTQWVLRRRSIFSCRSIDDKNRCW